MRKNQYMYMMRNSSLCKTAGLHKRSKTWGARTGRWIQQRWDQFIAFLRKLFGFSGTSTKPTSTISAADIQAAKKFMSRLERMKVSPAQYTMRRFLAQQRAIPTTSTPTSTTPTPTPKTIQKVPKVQPELSVQPKSAKSRMQAEQSILNNVRPFLP